MKLTETQLQVLGTLRKARNDHPTRVWFDAPYLISHYLDKSGTHYSLQGLHRTAASLVRKGLAFRRMLNGHTHYQISDEGMRELADRRAV